tara:strand:- start:1070 stop:1300 length:231 start_codon:yes stop_codon:yes gene_type:complete
MEKSVPQNSQNGNTTAGFFAFNTNSNNPGQVSAYASQPDFPDTTRPDNSNLQQYKDLIFQKAYAVAWGTSRARGVI